MVFVIAALFKIEKPTPQRLTGLFVGFIGISILILSQHGMGSTGHWSWLLLALLVPLTFAFEDLMMAAKMPADEDMVTLIGLSAGAAAIMLLPLVLLFDDFFPLALIPGKTELTVLLLALKTLIGMGLLAYLLTTAGAVFGSQAGYIKAFAGIIWSMLLLSESLSWVAWLSFGIILAGLALVESSPKDTAAPHSPKSTQAPLTPSGENV